MASDDQDIAEFLGSAQARAWWRRPRVWLAIGVAVLATIILLALLNRSKGPEYVTARVENRSLHLTVTATGNLRPTNQVQVGSEVSGRIDDVYVDVNDHVRRGEVLARINTDVINDQITRGEAELQAARAAVDQAQAALEVDKAQLARLEKVRKLSGGRVPSKTEIDAAKGTVKRDEAALASSKANVLSAQATLSSAKTNRDRAVIRSPVSGVVLARQVEPGQTVAASFNTPTLFVLAQDLSTMQLRVNVDEADVGQVKAGQKATFTVDAYPGREFPAKVERVDLASSNTAQTSGSSAGSSTSGQSNSVVNYEARLTVNNSAGLLRPGMTATATIATEDTPKGMVVPDGALRFQPPEKAKRANGIKVGRNNFGLKQEKQQVVIGAGSRQLVYVLQGKDKLKPIEVTTGLSDGRETLVKSKELKPGMKVVVAIKAKAGA